MPSEPASESNTQTESESSILNATPGSMTDGEKRIFAWRRWYGLGPDGREIEEWTQERIASYLGVSTRTVRRWVKEEPAPVFDGLSRRQREFIFGAIITGRGEVAEEYLELLSLEGRLSARQDSSPVKSSGAEESENHGSSDDSHPFAGLDEIRW